MAPDAGEQRFAEVASYYDNPELERERQSLLFSGDARRERILLQGSRDRALLNKMLRPRDHRIRKSLTADDMKYLSASREHMLMNPFIDQDGGFITAEEIGNEVIQIRDKATAIADLVRTIPTQAASISFPTASISPTMAKRGKATGASITATALADIFGKQQFTPQGKDIILKVPTDLVEDATFDLVAFLATEIARISREDDETSIIQGDGSGEALGILNALVKLYDDGTTAVGWDGQSGFSGAAFTEADIQVMDLQIHANAAAGASFLGPRLFEEKVRLFRTKEGGVGTGMFMFKRALEAGSPNTLNGFPLFRSEFFPDNITSGSAGDPIAAFVDLRDYWFIVRAALNVSFLAELYREESSYGYAWAKRVDGSLVRADGAIYLRHQ